MQMERVKYQPEEITGRYTDARGRRSPIFAPPITPRENYLALFTGKRPLWMPMTMDVAWFSPRLDPDNIARGFVMDGEPPMDIAAFGGKDMFGIPWVFDEKAGGSMVRPGEPTLLDARDWEKKLTFPDVTAWDWEGASKTHAPWCEAHKDKLLGWTLLNGFTFERLISFMDFGGAAMALADADQQEAVIALSQAILDRVYTPYLQHIARYFPTVQKIILHDDWGSQRSPIFSLATARKTYVPLLRQFAAQCKALGFIFELHSCGKNEPLVPAYIEAGVQTWNGMRINDKQQLFEQYGTQFVFAVDAPDIALQPDASPEELQAAAEAFCTFYIRNGQCRTVASVWGCQPAYVEALYCISRQMLG